MSSSADRHARFSPSSISSVGW